MIRWAAHSRSSVWSIPDRSWQWPGGIPAASQFRSGCIPGPPYRPFHHHPVRTRAMALAMSKAVRTPPLAIRVTLFRIPPPRGPVHLGSRYSMGMAMFFLAISGAAPVPRSFLEWGYGPPRSNCPRLPCRRRWGWRISLTPGSADSFLISLRASYGPPPIDAMEGKGREKSVTHHRLAHPGHGGVTLSPRR